MEFLKTEIPGVLIIKPRVFTDHRGYFFETFSQREFEREVPGVTFVQDNESRSCRGVMRGLHFQRPPYAQSKLVRCVVGRVLDVAVDLRYGSPTFGKHIAVELSADNKLQLFIPQGFAHGYAVLSDDAIFQYKCDNHYTPESEGGLDMFDPAIGIEWPFSGSEAITSEKDAHYPTLSELGEIFHY